MSDDVPYTTRAEVEAFLSRSHIYSATTRALAVSLIWWMRRCYALEQRMIDGGGR